LLQFTEEVPMNAPQWPCPRAVAATMTSREFNQQTSRAKQAADKGPVVITDRGRPAYVLLSHREYERLTARPNRSRSAFDALAMPETANIDLMDFVPPRRVEPERFDWHDLLDDADT
jgi:PHD/YefM family antitoxin component YafN of YafNO toxin-antitoxin module